MRRPERIPIVMENMDFEKFIADLNLLQKKSDVKKLAAVMDKMALEKYWIENPDERLTQVLVNTGILPNVPGLWYYIEEVDWLIEKKILKFEEIKFWGRNYDANKNRLPQTQFVVLKELSKSHIRNIMRDCPQAVPESYA